MSRHFSPTSLRDATVDLLTGLYVSGRELVARHQVPDSPMVKEGPCNPFAQAQTNMQSALTTIAEGGAQ